MARVGAGGRSEAARVWIAQLRSWLWMDRTLVVLQRPTGGREAVPAGIEVREATGDDGAGYERNIGTDSAVTFRRRLSTPGGSCWLALAGDAIVHASWVETEAAWVGEVSRYFVVPAGDGYIYESFTRPEMRGRGVYPAVLTAIAAALRPRGLNRLWIAAEQDNRPSLRAMEKAGFVPVSEIRMRLRVGRTTVATSGHLQPRLELTRPPQKTTGSH
jgi:GNAT superfamily N-acetyltransferase